MDKTEYERQMGIVRGEIDAIDQKLIPLLMERMRCSEKVAGIKQEAGMPVLDAQREKAILDGIRQKAGEYGASISSVYAGIMAASRMRQHQILKGGDEIRDMVKNAAHEIRKTGVTVFYQGVAGAYSHKAALRFFGDIPLTNKETWEDVFEAVKSGGADYGVVPVENSSAGSVADVYRLILDYRFYIVGAIGVKVSHCLAGISGDQTIDTVVSHPQGLAQCSGYIKKNGFTAMEFSNTAAAAKFVAEEKPEHTAAICSEEAAKEYGLHIIDQDVQDSKHNVTRFVVISKHAVLPGDAEKISLCFSLPHTTGSLYRILEIFALNGLNLTKIESRPIPDRNFEYDFYLDFSGNIHDEPTLDLISSLSRDLPRFSFLGNYEEKGGADEG